MQNKAIKPIKPIKGYIRKEIYPINTVLSKAVIDRKKGDNDLVEFDGDKIHMASDRYKTFALKGTKCVCCGLEAKYFAKETSNGIGYHFNLYGTDSNGKEMLFTKDHILPKSKGGRNHIDNYQTMCEKCNKEKGNTI